MKSYSKIIACAGLAFSGLMLGGCQNDFKEPEMVTPTATMTANTTIAEFKAKMWQDEDNYAIRCPYKDEATKTPYIIKGRVISADNAGNVYKSLYIQDATGAITFSINQSNMSAVYAFGQEIVVNVTGMYIGKYAGLEQLGWVSEYNGSYQVGFMGWELFANNTQANGWPDTAMKSVRYGDPYPTDGLYTINCDLKTLQAAASDKVKARELMSQLVEIDDVYFQDASKPWTEGYIVGSLQAGVSKVTSNDDVIWSANADMDNSIVIAPTADCKDITKCLVMELPVGSLMREKVNLVNNPDRYGKLIKVTGTFDKFLGTYGITGNKGTKSEFWMADIEELNTEEALEGYKSETFATKNTSVSRTIIGENGGSMIVRTSGYSDFWNYALPVGTGKVTGLLSYFNGAWQLVLRSEKDCSGFFQGGVFAEPMSIADVIAVENGQTPDTPDDPGNNDTPDDTPDLPAAAGNGTEANPYNVAYVYKSTADESGVWVEGYVAGYVDATSASTALTSSNGIFSATDEGKSGAFAQETNILLSAFAPGQSSVKNSMPVQLTAATRPTLGLKSNPSVFGKKVKIKGNIKSYFGVRGLRNITDVVVE